MTYTYPQSWKRAVPLGGDYKKVVADDYDESSVKLFFFFWSCGLYGKHRQCFGTALWASDVVLM